MNPAAYEALRSAAPTLRETAPRRLSELELQAALYAGELGLSWSGEDGETVEVQHFGSWNREPGPDFIGARISVNGTELTGDIEVDPDVRDWENHGHAINKDFGQVVLHLFLRRGTKRFFTRTWESKAVTQVCLDLRQPTKPSGASQGHEPLPPEKTRALVEAAAGFRLRGKIAAFRRTEMLCGRAETVFQGLAIGLGYKNNKVPFQLVAQRSGLSRAAAGGGESLLFGLAGFLQADDFDEGDDAAKDYLGDLWREWWAMRDREARLILPPAAWKFAALRPANHPHRRMGALAQITRSFTSILRTVEGKSVRQFCETLTSLDHPYWRWHASVAREALPKATALIGDDRARDLAINVLLPALSYEEAHREMAASVGPTPNRKILQAVEWLGEGTKSPLLRSAWHQQGLLQLHADFFPRNPPEVWADFTARLTT